MDGAEATASPPLGAWASLRGFFTPATLFLVVNLVIGTIALTSRSHSRRRRRASYHDDPHHQEPLHQPPQDEYVDAYYAPPQQYASPPPPPPAPLARTSSVLERLRSLGLYRFRSGDFPPEYAAASHAHAQDGVSHVVVPPADDDEARQGHYGRSRSEPAPAPVREEKRAAAPSRMKKSSSEMRKAEVVGAPARVVEAAVVEEDDNEDVVVDARADGFTGNFTPPPQELHLHYQQEYVPPPAPAPAPAPLARTPSMLDRLRSFGSLYRFRSGDLAPEYAAAAEDKKQQQAAHTHYDRSRSEPAKKQAAAEARMSKSSSEARKAAAPASTVEEEGVDARADDFINRFRQQLQLQRLNSLLNYKEMLNPGAKR